MKNMTNKEHHQAISLTCVRKLIS